MRKSPFSLILITLVVVSFVLVATLGFGTAQSGTSVSGIISSDTTWTFANSPYNFTGSVFVNSGVTLRIEAGVTLYLNDHSLTVNGTLNARGTGINKISFISATPTLWSSDGLIVFLSGSSNWNQQTNSGCIIENAIISSIQPVNTIYIVDSSPKINHCVISDPNVNEFSTAISIVASSTTVNVQQQHQYHFCSDNTNNFQQHN
jgi:hypothetical protein